MIRNLLGRRHPVARKACPMNLRGVCVCVSVCVCACITCLRVRTFYVFTAVAAVGFIEEIEGSFAEV